MDVLMQGLARWLLDNEAALCPPGRPTTRQQKDDLADAFPAELAEGALRFFVLLYLLHCNVIAFRFSLQSDVDANELSLMHTDIIR